MANSVIYSRAYALQAHFTEEDRFNEERIDHFITRSAQSGEMSAFIPEKLSERIEKYLKCLGYELTTQKWDATAGADGNGAWVDIGGTNISWELKEDDES